MKFFWLINILFILPNIEVSETRAFLPPFIPLLEPAVDPIQSLTNIGMIIRKQVDGGIHQVNQKLQVGSVGNYTEVNKN